MHGKACFPVYQDLALDALGRVWRVHLGVWRCGRASGVWGEAQAILGFEAVLQV